jgi:hypothetical protein
MMIGDILPVQNQHGTFSGKVIRLRETADGRSSLLVEMIEGPQDGEILSVFEEAD